MTNKDTKFNFGTINFEDANFEFVKNFTKAYATWFIDYAAFYLNDEEMQNLIDNSYSAYYDFFLQVTFTVLDITVKPDFYTKSDFCVEWGLNANTTHTFDKKIMSKAIKEAKKKFITPENRVKLFDRNNEELRILCLTYCACYMENNLRRSSDESMFEEYERIYLKRKAEIEGNK